MLISDLIGSSPKFRAVLEEVQTVASADCAVLIRGETGTGKEMIARAIHDASPRRQHPFVAINCAAIPAALLESEFFGHAGLSLEPLLQGWAVFKPLID